LQLSEFSLAQAAGMKHLKRQARPTSWSTFILKEPKTDLVIN
jgi:hypothetical protein